MKTVISDFLRTSIGRRLFMLFAVSALLPLAVGAFLSLTQVRALLMKQGEQRVAALAKTYGMGLFERLLLAADVAVATAHNPTLGSGAESLAPKTFESLEIRRGTERQPILAGLAGPELPEPAQARLRAGKHAILVTDAFRSPRVYLAAPVDEASRVIVVGEVKADYLFGSIAELPALTDFCVVEDGSSRVLFCSAPMDESVLRAPRLAMVSRLPEMTWRRGDVDYISRTWMQFMREAFGTDDWAIVASQPQDSQLAGARQFAQLYIPVIGLALLFAAWLAVRQSRNIVRPVELLAERARGVARNDFGTRLGLERNDEFGELAGAFDQMTERLGRQFASLQALSEIDRHILSKNTEEVVRSVIGRMAEISGADLVTVTLFDHENRSNARTYFRTAEGVSMERRDLPAEDLAALTAMEDDFDVDLQSGGESLPSYLERARDDHMACAFVQRIVWRDDVCGVLVLGFRSGIRATAEQRERAREISDRVAVAVSSAWRDEQLYQQAHFDSLTGLPNRLLFKDRLEREAERSRRDGSTFAVLFVDLDHFKNVNDSFGHSAGDAVLREAASRVALCVRASDTVARFGGDEFAVLITGLHHPQEAWLLSETVVERLSTAFEAGGHTCFLSASVGIALFPEDGESAEALLKSADTAMYRAKSGGRSQVVFFEEKMNSEAVSRLTLDRELRGALEREELTLHYQPQLDLKTGKLIAAEALLRWNRPGHGFVPPARFIPLAEQSGLIDQIGQWTIERACAQIHAWHAEGIPIERVAVNVSPRQFRRRSIVKHLRDALARHQIPASALEIEITEGLLLEQGPSVEGMLHEIAEAGHPIALDDFGTGFSSMSYLKRFPVHTIKIDRVFIEGLGGGPDSEAIVAAIIAMSHALGKSVIAEGVETQKQLAVLRRLGCDEMQGFLLSPALPPDGVGQLVRARSVALTLG
ncbi:MAG TPA: EAL domain-containing protein [Usitatibacter sp.]|nr:EAL domain-containing protein [Usitatibacter sp.]